MAKKKLKQQKPEPALEIKRAPESKDAQLARIIELLEQMVALSVQMVKPESRFSKIAKLISAAITFLGILSVVDVIKNWIGG